MYPCGRSKQRWQDAINVDMKNAHVDTDAMFDHVRSCKPVDPKRFAGKI